MTRVSMALGFRWGLCFADELHLAVGKEVDDEHSSARHRRHMDGVRREDDPSFWVIVEEGASFDGKAEIDFPLRVPVQST